MPFAFSDYRRFSPVHKAVVLRGSTVYTYTHIPFRYGMGLQPWLALSAGPYAGSPCKLLEPTGGGAYNIGQTSRGHSTSQV